MFREFKKFVLRGNVVDLAVGVVMGVAFGKIIDAIVKNLITPLISLIAGKPNFGFASFSIRHTHFGLGTVLNELFSFIATAAAIFFFVVKPINHLMSRARTEPTPDPTTKKCPECLSEIPIDARRCAFCTTELAAA